MCCMFVPPLRKMILKPREFQPDCSSFAMLARIVSCLTHQTSTARWPESSSSAILPQRSICRPPKHWATGLRHPFPAGIRRLPGPLRLLTVLP